MRKLRLVAVSLVIAAVAVISASAQTATGKIGLINTAVFADPKEGIAKYVTAVTTLNNEFKPVAAELDGIAQRIQNLEKEIKTLQEQAQGKVPVNQTTVSNKVEEYEKLAREYKFKQEDAEARYNRRSESVLGPIRQDISTALQEFVKKNGYSILLDAGKLYEAGLLLGLDEAVDVTKQFIAFYNARPATAAK